MRPRFSISVPFLLFLLLLTALPFAAFSVNDYLLYGESPDQVTQENFVYHGMQYTLVKIAGKETFLLLSGEPVENQTEIEPPLTYYYRAQFYPTDDEWANVTALVTRFNNSRNNGETGILNGPEESSCRQALFIDGHVKIGSDPVQCIDDVSCDLNSKLVFQAYNQGVGFGAPEIVLPILKSFAFASNGVENTMQQFFARLEGRTDEDAYATLQYIHDAIPALRSNQEVIETTPFRSPVPGDPVDQESCIGVCYALCPPMRLDGTALNELETTTTSLMQKVRPYSTHAELSTQIQDQTSLRFHFRDLENQATFYSATFSPLQQKASQATREGDNALRIVLNLSLKAKVDELKQLSLDINRSIEQRNFTNIQDRLSELQLLTNSVHNGVPGTLAIYNGTVEARKGATVMLLLLETRDLEANQKAELAQLEDLESQLDAVFSTGLTAGDYGNLTTAYQIITQRSHLVMKSQDESPVFFASSKFRGFARRVGRGISEAMVIASLKPEQVTPTNPFLQVFSVFTFLSLTALATFLTLSFFSGMKKISRLNGVGGFLVIGGTAVLLLLFSFGLYNFLDKTVHNADLSEFLFDFNRRSSTTIAVDTTQTDAAAANAMFSCAQSLSNTIHGLNKSVVLYRFDDQTCQETGADGNLVFYNVTDCLASVGNSSSLFVYHYSVTPKPPKIYTIFQNRFDVYGDEDYYRACALSLVFKG